MYLHLVQEYQVQQLYRNIANTTSNTDYNKQCPGKTAAKSVYCVLTQQCSEMRKQMSASTLHHHAAN